MQSSSYHSLISVKRNARGFTLVELAVVLVIIGLIVGGVLAGRSLLHSSQLQSIITDEERYVTAVRTFQSKYNALPGDMTNATSYWGSRTGGCDNAGPFPETPQTLTCNGNGNGFIENEYSVNSPALNTPMSEGFYAWQQLADAGLVTGAFSGVAADDSWTGAKPGVNLPETRLGGGFQWVTFTAANAASAGSGAFMAPIQADTQYLLIGGKVPFYSAYGPLFYPTDAYNIDKKVDDGIASSGNIFGSNGWDADGSCLTSTWPSTVYYYNVQANPHPYCSLLWKVVF